MQIAPRKKHRRSCLRTYRFSRAYYFCALSNREERRRESCQSSRGSTRFFLSYWLVSALLLLAEFTLAVHVEAVSIRDAAELIPRKTAHDVNINDIIDNNMDDIRNILSEMDPTDLRDITNSITSHIYIDLHTGWLQNLSQLKRFGRCGLYYTNKVLSVEMNFKWDEIAFDYRYLLKVFLVSRTGDFHGQLSDLRVNIVIDVDFESYQITLRRLNLLHAGKITISLEGHITDKIYNLVLKGITFVCKKLVLRTIESKSVMIVQSKIDDFNLSIGKNHNRKFTFVNLTTPNYIVNSVN